MPGSRSSTSMDVGLGYQTLDELQAKLSWDRFFGITDS
jgi:hypothetical protein